MKDPVKIPCRCRFVKNSLSRTLTPPGRRWPPGSRPRLGSSRERLRFQAATRSSLQKTLRSFSCGRPQLPMILAASNHLAASSRSGKAGPQKTAFFVLFSATGQAPPQDRSPARRQAHGGTVIQKQAPSPGVPVSRIVIPEIPRISRAKKRPCPVFFP